MSVLKIDREEIIEKIEDVADSNCCWYEICEELLSISNVNQEDYNLDETAENGDLYYEMIELLNGLSDEELLKYAEDYDYI